MFKILLVGLALAAVLLLFLALPAQAVSSDSGCTNIGGTCQANCATQCYGPGYECRSGLCTGSTARQCCAPTGTGGGGQPRTTFETTGGGGIVLPNPLGVTSFTALINNIIDYLLIIGAPILTLMIIIGAFQILTAAGNAEKVTKARKTITYAVVGYAVILLARGLILVIQNVLGVQ